MVGYELKAPLKMLFLLSVFLLIGSYLEVALIVCGIMISGILELSKHKRPVPVLIGHHISLLKQGFCSLWIKLPRGDKTFNGHIYSVVAVLEVILQTVYHERFVLPLLWHIIHTLYLLADVSDVVPF